MNVRLKKHPSFKRKAFLPTRRRATLVSVLMFVLNGDDVFPWILVTYGKSGEPIQNVIMLFFFLDQFAVIYDKLLCCPATLIVSA